jgi:hypothetical protein
MKAEPITCSCALTQAHDRLQGLHTQKKLTSASLLEEHLELVYAAKDWQVAGLSAISHSRICEAFDTLDKKYPVPEVNRIAYTSRLAVEYLQAKRFEAWAAIVMPYAAQDDDAEGKAAAWHPSRAAFSAFAVPSDPEKKSELFKGWIGSIINDAFLSFVVDASDGDDASLRGCCEAWLLSWLELEKNKPQQPKPWSDYTPLTYIVSLLKGLLALCDPSPKPFGASIKEVSFVMPIEGETSGQDTLLSVSRTSGFPHKDALIRWLHKATPKGNKLWEQRKKDYIRVCAAEDEFEKPIFNLFADVSNITDSIQSEGHSLSIFEPCVADSLTRYTQSVQVWRKALRDGATKLLEVEVVTICKWVAARVKDIGNDKEPGEVVKIITAANDAMKATADSTPGAQDVRQSTAELVLIYKESGSKQELQLRLQEIIEAGKRSTITADMMKGLKEAYDKARSGHSKDMLQKLKQSRSLVWSFWVDQIVSAPNIEEFAIPFLTATLEDPALKEICGGDEASADWAAMLQIANLFEKVVNVVAKINAKKDTNGKWPAAAESLFIESAGVLRNLKEASAETTDLHCDLFQASLNELRVHAASVVEEHTAFMSAIAESWMTHSVQASMHRFVGIGFFVSVCLLR